MHDVYWRFRIAQGRSQFWNLGMHVRDLETSSELGINTTGEGASRLTASLFSSSNSC
jgi:hypothetical protein